MCRTIPRNLPGSRKQGLVLPRVCLVTSTHVSANPRLVKEADALFECGFGVSVVAVDQNSRLRELDRILMRNRGWRLRKVSRGSLAGYVAKTFLQHFARFALRTSQNLKFAVWAHHRLSGRLGRASARIAADIYIAHNLAALPAAVHAAKRNHAKVGFDAEDFHTEEVTETERNFGDQIAREILERKLLFRCEYRTASSPMIAEAYRQKYGAEMLPVLNVFPLRHSPPAPLEPTIPHSLYWFSQTIGAGRGLEEIVEAVARMEKPAVIYLRGNPAVGYVNELSAFAERKSVLLRFLAPEPPDAMVGLASAYSIGLGLEPGNSRNNGMALSNKIFTYLLAGVPVLLSRTPAQETLARDLGDAAVLVDLDQPAQIARTLQDFFADEARQRSARSTAWHLGRAKYNWNVEKAKLVSCVRKSLENRR